MHIDALHFTPVVSLAGGAMIGAAAALLILGIGRILGASGLFAGALFAHGPDDAWRYWCLAGLIAAPVLARVAFAAHAPTFVGSGATLMAGGFLVGFGARLGSGCTSGHGVCGLARLSPRSLVATLVFMAAGFTVVFLARHVAI